MNVPSPEQPFPEPQREPDLNLGLDDFDEFDFGLDISFIPEGPSPLNPRRSSVNEMLDILEEGAEDELQTN